MAASYFGHSDAEQALIKSETKTIKPRSGIPRRKVTLICITLLLNVLIWSAIVCLVTSLYQIVSDPRDMTNVAPVVLTLTSALATIVYVFVHTFFSHKQKAWEQQQRNSSAVKKTPYVAVRLVISLCVLWLLTTGWNMIIVARRPMCLREAPGLQGWESGPICVGSRVGMAFAAISLIMSCVLFAVLAVVNRPFEAHLFRHGYQKPANIPHPPYPSFAPHLTDSRMGILEKSIHDQHGPASTRRSRSFDTVSRRKRLTPPFISAPSGISSSDSRIFTSPYAPPPIPPAYIAAQRSLSVGTADYPSYLPINRGSLTRPPRLSGTTRKLEASPLSVPARYSVSTWRAIHPNGLTSVPPLTDSYVYLHSTESYYRSQYSRSSITLTRPTRLSSRSSSQRGSDALQSRSNRFSDSVIEGKSASRTEAAYARENGAPLADMEHVKSQIRHHTRTASTPHAASNREFRREHDVKIITRKPVPVRKLKSANRVGISSTFIYAETAEDSINRTPNDSRNGLGSSGYVGARRMTFEQVKNKPLPKIAVF